jgi:transcriptional regulator with XRE-family HTH domain
VSEWLLGSTLKRLRTERGLSLRTFGRQLGVDHRTVDDWDRARSYPSSLDVPRIAGTLGVRICELYGVEEGHDQERAPNTDWIRQLVEALEERPERIEINLYKEGGHKGGALAARGRTPAGEEFEPPLGLRFMQAFLAEGRWREMPETERNQWRELAEAIRREEGAANGPGSRPHGRGYP